MEKGTGASTQFNLILQFNRSRQEAERFASSNSQDGAAVGPITNSGA